MTWSLAKYDSGSPGALRRLVAAGAELRPFPRETMVAAYDIAFDLYEEVAAKNPKFKKIYDSWKPFRDEAYLWFRVAENTFDNFVFSQQATKKR
jgi:TRAP-type mannitol/chloroaromatic compound transport system substrate-binding protein